MKNRRFLKEKYFKLRDKKKKKRKIHCTPYQENDSPNISNWCLNSLCLNRFGCCVLITTAFKMLRWCLT